MSSPVKTIVWFRRDLRIEDNQALAAAAREGTIIPVFIWCPNDEGKFYPGRVSRWWIKQSLIHLGDSLKSLGASLILIKAESTLAALLQCIGAVGASQVFYNHLYDPVSLVRDHKIKSQLVDLGVTVKSFNGDLLYEPWEVYDDNGHAFTSFSAYWAKCMSLSVEPPSILPAWKLVPPTGTENIQSCSFEELGLENQMEKASNALLSRGWSPGWSNADKLLTEFLSGHLLEYSENRMKVEGITTSMLSPYLHFGEISIRKIYQSVRIKQLHWAKDGKTSAEESVNLFLRSLGLREYSRYICFNFPFTHERSLLGNLRHYPWRTDESQFKAWRQGKTGYPFVDAGMRELWATGWLHNRTRVVVASFFVKCLLLPWTWGMKYFWDTLMDADLESDILGWQYISGSLPDGHELNRLDSPEAQGFKYDPDGEYVRTWVPELARLPAYWVHHPWDAPKSVLQAAGVELGSNYPTPIVEIEMAKDRLQDAVTMMWQLDQAAKSAEGGSSEVVADNLFVTKNLDIPTVIVKKEVPCTASSLDQRVPSMQNVHGALRIGSGLKNVSDRKSLGVDINRMEISKTDEDMLSTAESSSGRKRSISESQCAVPAGYISTSNVITLDGHESSIPEFSTGNSSKRPWPESVIPEFSTGTSSKRPWPESVRHGPDKEELDAQSEASRG